MFSISKIRFEQIRDEILVLIPNESTSETLENVCDGGLQDTPCNGLLKSRGKLYNKYINERRDLIKCGVITLNKSTNSEQSISNGTFTLFTYILKHNLKLKREFFKSKKYNYAINFNKFNKIRLYKF